MKLICVVGMHRSGTSIVARMLNLLGASLGPEEDLMPPRPDNPTGFWESRAIVQLHDDLMASFGGRWDAPAFRDDGWEKDSRLDPYRQRLNELIESRYADAGIAVWKDPRGSFFLPLWTSEAQVTHVILPLRDPSEVAASLQARNGMSSERSAYLWLRYNVAAWRNYRQPLIVACDEILKAPVTTARRMVAHVGLPEPDERVVSAIDAFIDSSLWHHRGTPLPDGQYMSFARGFYHALINAPLEVVGPFADLLHDRWKLLTYAEPFGEAARILGQMDPK